MFKAINVKVNLIYLITTIVNITAYLWCKKFKFTHLSSQNEQECYLILIYPLFKLNELRITAPLLDWSKLLSNKSVLPHTGCPKTESINYVSILCYFE